MTAFPRTSLCHAVRPDVLSDFHEQLSRGIFVQCFRHEPVERKLVLVGFGLRFDEAVASQVFHVDDVAQACTVHWGELKQRKAAWADGVRAAKWQDSDGDARQ